MFSEGTNITVTMELWVTYVIEEYWDAKIVGGFSMVYLASISLSLSFFHSFIFSSFFLFLSFSLSLSLSPSFCPFFFDLNSLSLFYDLIVKLSISFSDPFSSLTIFRSICVNDEINRTLYWKKYGFCLKKK